MHARLYGGSMEIDFLPIQNTIIWVYLCVSVYISVFVLSCPPISVFVFLCLTLRRGSGLALSAVLCPLCGWRRSKCILCDMFVSDGPV